MNEESIEYGLLVKNASYDEIRALAANDPDSDCAAIYGLAVETHPWNTDRVHVSFGVLGDVFPKETARARQIARWFKRHLPKAKVSWGVIHTER